MEHQETQNPVPFVQESLDKLRYELSTTRENTRKNISSGEDVILEEEMYG